MNKNTKKTPYDIKITFSLLKKPSNELTDVEKEAVKIYKNRVEYQTNDFAKYNERIKKSCKILCGGRFCERHLIPEYGWAIPIEKMAYKLEKLNYFYRKWGMHVQFDQVKEKFGTFRGYWSIQHDPCSFIGKIIHKLNDFLAYDIDYAKKCVVDEECHDTLEWEECSKDEYSNRLSRFGDACKNTKKIKNRNVLLTKKDETDHTITYFVYDKDTKKYFRSYWLMHSAKTHIEITKHKWLFKLSKMINNIEYLLNSLHRETTVECVMYENFYNEVTEIVDECEKECAKYCQICGNRIDEHGLYDKCETRGWIIYICDKCAMASGRTYFNHSTKKLMNECSIAKKQNNLKR